MVLFDKLKYSLQIKYWLVAIAGMLFSLPVWKIMTMEFRYALAIVGALIVLSLSMIAIKHIEDFLVYAFVFNIPFMIFGKWFCQHEVVGPIKGINVGLVELLLILAYMSWFARVFIVLKEPLPRLDKIDFFIILLIFVQLISLIKAPDKTIGSLDIIYNVKFVLLYFFIKNKVQHKHLKIIIMLFMFTIFLETSFAFMERYTGITNIASTKGDTTSEDFGSLYTVPGIEQETRASGTTNDPHTLGLYLSMLLPIPFAFLLLPTFKPFGRVVMGGFLVFGICGLVVTFSRSAWLSFGIASTLVLCISVFSWKQGKAVLWVLMITLAISVAYPKTYKIMYNRIVDAPSDIMESRYDMVWTALDIWHQNLLFGYGAGNYMTALHDPDIREQHVSARTELPVHNMLLYITAELGLFGAIAFFGIILIAMRHCWQLIKCKNLLIRGLSVSIIAGFIAYLVDGINNPMFREITPYAQLWVFVGLAMASVRISKEEHREVSDLETPCPETT